MASTPLHAAMALLPHAGEPLSPEDRADCCAEGRRHAGELLERLASPKGRGLPGSGLMLREAVERLQALPDGPAQQAHAAGFWSALETFLSLSAAAYDHRRVVQRLNSRAASTLAARNAEPATGADA